VVNIPVDISGNVCDADSSAPSSNIDEYKKWVDAAVVLNSPSIRVHIPHRQGGKANLPCALETLKALAAYGAEKNVVINLENDEPQTEDPFTVVDVIKTVNSPYLRALPDFCNSMLIGDDPKYNDRGLAAMFRYAYNVSHVKDSESDQGKLYTVDVAHIFGIARKAGYRGYFSMEFEGTGDPYEGTKKLLAQSLKALS
jgi:sugar phosphate isomerase/epimerase